MTEPEAAWMGRFGRRELGRTPGAASRIRGRLRLAEAVRRRLGRAAGRTPGVREPVRPLARDGRNGLGVAPPEAAAIRGPVRLEQTERERLAGSSCQTPRVRGALRLVETAGRADGGNRPRPSAVPGPVRRTEAATDRAGAVVADTVSAGRRTSDGPARIRAW